MPKTLQNLRDIRILKNGRALIGIVFFLSGVVILLDGTGRIRELWVQLAPYFPFALPQDAGERVLQSLPLIFATFISGVGSVSAVLIGGLWLLSGLAEVFRKEKVAPEPPDLADPGLVTESLRSSEAQYWRASSLPVRLLSRMMPRARFTSPVSYKMAASLLGSMVKIFFAAVLIAVVFHIFQLVPGLVKKYLQASLTLAVPSPRPLYLVLGFLMALNGLMALSLVVLKRNEFVRGRESLAIRGKGDPHLFLALLEEGCKLLSGKGLPDKRPVRLQHTENPHVRGSLIECFSEQARFFARPAAYCCLPLVFCFLTMGFSRLVHFRRTPDPMPYVQFLSFHSLDWLVEVAFALALILAGVYVADQAGRLFRIRRFQSALVFCQVGPQTPLRVSPLVGRRFSFSSGADARTWSIVDGVDPQFADWVKNPESPERFQCEVFWAQVVTETRVDEDEGRFVIAMEASAPLDDALRRIVLLPLHVNFEPAVEEPAEAANPRIPAGDGPSTRG